MHFLSRACLSLALLFAVVSASASEIREIESPAAEGSLAPSIVALGDGRLVLTWLEPSEDGHALKFSVLEEGRFGPARIIARGEGWFANWADTPGLFVLPNGDWVAHWLVKSGPSTYAYDVRMARSTNAGESWSAPVYPHLDGTPTEHGFVSYFVESEAAAGVVWLDGRRTSEESGVEGAMTLRTAVLGPDGALSGRALLDDRVCDCCQTASAMTAEGPIVVYRDRSEDEIRDHYFVRRIDGGWSEPKRLHEDGWRIGGCPVNGPAVLARAREVVTAWFTMPDSRPQVRLARSLDAGGSFELIGSLGEGSALGRVDIAWLNDGFVVSWIDEVDRRGVLRLTAYDGRGRRLWQRAVEGVDAGRASGFPRLAVLGRCELILAWTGKDDAGTQRVRVRSLTPDPDCGS